MPSKPSAHIVTSDGLTQFDLAEVVKERLNNGDLLLIERKHRVTVAPVVAGQVVINRRLRDPRKLRVLGVIHIEAE